MRNVLTFTAAWLLGFALWMALAAEVLSDTIVIQAASPSGHSQLTLTQTVTDGVITNNSGRWVLGTEQGNIAHNFNSNLDPWTAAGVGCPESICPDGWWPFVNSSEGRGYLPWVELNMGNPDGQIEGIVSIEGNYPSQPRLFRESFEPMDVTSWTVNPPVGDANLDGVFDSTDIIGIMVAGEYEDGIPVNSTWLTGDWDLDGEFGSGDLIAAMQAGTYGAAAVPEPSVVPEPSAAALILLGIVGLWRKRR